MFLNQEQVTQVVWVENTEKEMAAAGAHRGEKRHGREGSPRMLNKYVARPVAAGGEGSSHRQTPCTAEYRQDAEKSTDSSTFRSGPSGPVKKNAIPVF